MKPAAGSLLSSSPPSTHLVQWMVNGLEPKASLFHLGQYCGSWQASTQGKASASFHLVLHGQCHLHFEQGPSRLLQAGEGVFLLRDLPHRLTPFADPEQTTEPQPMQALQPEQPGTTGLACGFFELSGQTAQLLLASMPDWLLLEQGSPITQAVRPLFEMLLAEATDPHKNASPLIERLTELLFFYLVRDLAEHQQPVSGLWALAGHPQFSGLLRQLLENPAEPWSIASMAASLHMSRASFFKHFTEVCDLPPAQLLLVLRMQLAARKLREGTSVGRAAEAVGYLSQAAFTRAFKKVIGKQPGAYQRDFRNSPQDAAFA